MRSFTFALLCAGVIGFSSATRAVTFDIYNEAGVNVGFIEFTEAGILESTDMVVDFDYTQNDGDHFEEADISQLRVLVDDVNGTLCWGDWTVPGTTAHMYCGLSGPADVPRGLTATNGNGSFNAFDNFSFEYGLPNRVSALGDDDQDLTFVFRAPCPDERKRLRYTIKP